MGRERLSYLDGLRGILALIVFNEHFIKAFYPLSNLQEVSYLSITSFLDYSFVFSPLQLITNGGFAVSGFFVLSGYVISISIMQRKQHQLGEVFFRVFKRYLRLAIPVTISLLFIFLLHYFDVFMFAEHGKDNLNLFTPPFIEGEEPELLVLLQQGMYHSIFYVYFPFNPVLWTMAPEMWGSLLVIICGYLASKFISDEKQRTLVSFVVSAIFIITLIDYVIVGLAIGPMLFHGMNLVGKENLNKFWLKLLMLVIGLGLVLLDVKGASTNPLGFFDTEFHNTSDRYTYFSFAWFFILFSIVQSRTIQKSLAAPGLANIGKCSFGIYLFHYALIGSLGIHIVSTYQEPLYITSWVSGMACLSISILMGSLMYRYIERPIMQLKRPTKSQDIFGKIGSSN